MFRRPATSGALLPHAAAGVGAVGIVVGGGLLHLGSVASSRLGRSYTTSTSSISTILTQQAVERTNNNSRTKTSVSWRPSSRDGAQQQISRLEQTTADSPSSSAPAPAPVPPFAILERLGELEHTSRRLAEEVAELKNVASNEVCTRCQGPGINRFGDCILCLRKGTLPPVLSGPFPTKTTTPPGEVGPSVELGYINADTQRQAMQDFIVTEFKKNTGIDLSKGHIFAMKFVTAAAERAKRELLSSPQTEIHLPFSYGSAPGGPFSNHARMTITRREFEGLVCDLIREQQQQQQNFNQTHNVSGPFPTMTTTPPGEVGPSVELGYIDADTQRQAMQDIIVTEFKKNTGIDLSKGHIFAMKFVTAAAERARKELLSSAQTEIHLPFSYGSAGGCGSNHARMTITRCEFEWQVGYLIRKQQQQQQNFSQTDNVATTYKQKLCTKGQGAGTQGFARDRCSLCSGKGVPVDRVRPKAWTQAGEGLGGGEYETVLTSSGIGAISDPSFWIDFGTGGGVFGALLRGVIVLLRVYFLIFLANMGFALFCWFMVTEEKKRTTSQKS